MAQTNFNNTDIDSDTDSDSNSSSRSGNLQFVGSDFTKKGTRRRSTSHHLLMDAIEGSEEEKVPLPDYERLSQSMRLPEDVVQETQKTLTHSQSHVQKPIGWKLIDKVFKRDGDKEKEKEKEKEGYGDSTPVNKEKKKKSSWLPDPEKRWPIQGWS